MGGSIMKILCALEPTKSVNKLSPYYEMVSSPSVNAHLCALSGYLYGRIF